MDENKSGMRFDELSSHFSTIMRPVSVIGMTLSLGTIFGGDVDWIDSFQTLINWWEILVRNPIIQISQFIGISISVETANRIALGYMFFFASLSSIQLVLEKFKEVEKELDWDVFSPPPFDENPLKTWLLSFKRKFFLQNAIIRHQRGKGIGEVVYYALKYIIISIPIFSLALLIQITLYIILFIPFVIFFSIVTFISYFIQYYLVIFSLGFLILVVRAKKYKENYPFANGFYQVRWSVIMTLISPILIFSGLLLISVQQ